MNRLQLTTAALAATLTFAAHAQAPNPPITTAPTIMNFTALTEQGKALLEQARKGSGSAGITLENDNGHHTMLTARTKSGGGEQHNHWADFLIILDGEGTELTGGTMVDPKPGADGELHGSRLEGATPHKLHKGDILHIPAGTPHQAIEDEGQSLVVFVIKVPETTATN